MLKNKAVLVSKDIFNKSIQDICKAEEISLDTETTGLFPYHGDRPFSVAISTPDTNYYFNFNKMVDIPADLILPRESFGRFQQIADMSPRIYMQNAKFDMHHMGLDWSVATIYCTEVMGRLRNNERKSYSLANQAKLIGMEKDDTVMEHIKSAKLYEPRSRAGREWKQPCFEKAPFQMIAKYAMIDSEVTLMLGQAHMKFFEKQPAGTKKNPMMVLVNESRLTRVVHRMEKTGVQCDMDYTENSLAKTDEQHTAALEKFKELTDVQFLDSSLVYSRVFHDTDAKRFVQTAKGNLEFSKPVLKTFEHPAANLVIEIRKLASDMNFFKQFLFAADAKGVIHTDYRQPGTRTGRFSSRNPNLQNLKKASEDDGDIVVRRAFVPRPGFRFFMIDYDQMEYRMMLDYAGAMGLIKLVLSGLDVHTATANVAGVTRTIAKNVNFGTLYGQGMGSLAASIGVPVAEAARIQHSIFEAAPEVKKFINKVCHTAITRRQLYNWAGRCYQFPYKWMSYKAPNTLIQGGAAEVVRFAMTGISNFLAMKKCESRMLLNIHDELIFEIKDGEEDLIPRIKRIMETTYPHKHLPLTCGVECSAKSLADKEKWNG